MESLIQIYDEVEDAILTTLVRLRRSLARKPRERRRVARLPETTAKPSTTAGQ